MSIIRLKHSIDYPEDYSTYGITQHLFFYENKSAKMDLQKLFDKVDEFIENDLPITVINLKSLLDNHTFIDLNKFNIIIDTEDMKALKNAIRTKINNEYDSLTYRTLELYYYPPNEIANAASYRLHWHLKLKSKLSDLNFEEKSIPYGDYLLENLTINKLVELASDFNIQIPKILLLPK